MIERDHVRMGIAASLSGRYARFGRQALEGLRCFVRDRNDAGGVRDSRTGAMMPIALRVEDDRGDERTARRAVEMLIDEGVDLLIGPYGSGLTLVAAEVAEQRAHVLWNHGGSSDEIFQRGYRWTVGIISPASRYLVGILELLRSVDPPIRGIAVVGARTGFASQVAKGAMASIERAGRESAREYFYDTGTTDFAPILAALAADPPDAVLGAGRFEDDLLLASRLAAARLPIKAAALVGAGVSDFGEALGPSAEGFFGPSQWEPTASHAIDCGPTSGEFVSTYTNATREMPDYPAAQGYAAGLIAIRCIEEAAALDQSALRDAASRLRCTTFYGPFAIDPESGVQNAHSLVVTQWQGGKRKVVWPPAGAGTRATFPAAPGRR